MKSPVLKNKHSTLRSLSVFLTSVLTVVLLILPSYASAGCSPYIGQASLNEFFKDSSNQTNTSADFVEVKILNNAIDAPIYNNWNIKLCERNTGNNNSGDGCSALISVGTFSELTKPWLILNDGASSYVGKYINMKSNFDAVLLDSAGNLVDYFSLGGYSKAIDAVLTVSGSTCALTNLVFDYDFSSTGTSAKSLHRNPDGVGDWGKTTSGADPGTTDGTNDIPPGPEPLPIISVSDVIVNKGGTATFTFTLKSQVSYVASVDYKTTLGTAVPSTAPVGGKYDYTYKTGTVTFAANSPANSTVTVDVITNGFTPTPEPTTTGTVYLYLQLYNQVNADIRNAYPIGTILGAASGEWYMDESSWSNTTNEVSDFTSNANHGTPKNNVSTSFPGKLCNAGSFDGVDDYVEIPHSASLNGSDQLTYSVWINPTAWFQNSNSINQIMAKSVHGDTVTGSIPERAQMGIFSENNRLVGRAETVGNIRHEVFTTLPATSNWSHIALVFSGNSLTLYINGVAAPNADASHPSSKIFTSTTLVQTNDPLLISKRVKTNKYYFQGLIDEALVMKSSLPSGFIKIMYDNYQLGKNWNGAARSCSAALHHFEIDHDGTALTCSPEQVTIRACTNATCTAPHYANPVNITLSPSGWVGGNSQSITTGVLTPKLAITTASTVSLNITNSTVSPSNGLAATICKNTTSLATGVVGTAACNLTFKDTGFIYTVPTQTSCATSAPITIQAVRTDDTTKLCIPEFQNKDRSLKVWASYGNPVPAAITGTPAVTMINGKGTYTLPSTEPAATNVTMSFAASADETFTIAYPDAGQLILNTKYEGTAANSDTGLTMLGSTTFVVKPAKLYVYSDDTNANCASNNGTCSAFKPAGNAASSQFNLKVRAACADNSATPNFVLNNITISHTNTAPAVAQGNFAVNSFNMAAADNGEHIITTQSVSEVGAFTFTATSPSYLGVTGPVGTSTYIGRFYPHHFDTTVAQSCGTFSYSGQNISVTSTAQNNWLATPTVTQNYTGSFAYDTTLSNTGDTTNLTQNIIPAASFNNGTANKADVLYTFPTKETIPLSITLRANDTDTGTTAGVTEGTTEIRSGRTRVENTYGSELVDMAVTAHVEYYNTNGFEINTADTCSTISVNLTDIGGAADPIVVGDGSAVGQTCVWDDDAESGANNCSGASPGPVASQFEEPPVAGTFNLNLKAPDANNTGDIGLTLTSPTWLKYDWDGNGTHDNDPTGVASFGLYRGDDRVIYWREVFQ